MQAGAVKDKGGPVRLAAYRAGLMFSRSLKNGAFCFDGCMRASRDRAVYEEPGDQVLGKVRQGRGARRVRPATTGCA